MALSKQPYFPLYVRDYMSDERLSFCSLGAVGLFFRLICIMHLSEQYGHYILNKNSLKNLARFSRKKDTRSGAEKGVLEGSKECSESAREALVNALSTQLSKSTSNTKTAVKNALNELIDAGILVLTDNGFYQPEMVKMDELSQKRAISGEKGVIAKRKKKENLRSKGSNDFAEAFAIAKCEANSENEIEIENANENENEIENELKNVSASVLALVKARAGSEGELEMLLEWLKLRSKKGLPTTEKVVELNLAKIPTLASSCGLTVSEFLSETVRRGWCNFYEITKNESKKVKNDEKTAEKSSFSIEEFDNFTLGKYIVKKEE